MRGKFRPTLIDLSLQDNNQSFKIQNYFDMKKLTFILLSLVLLTTCKKEGSFQTLSNDQNDSVQERTDDFPASGLGSPPSGLGQWSFTFIPDPSLTIIYNENQVKQVMLTAYPDPQIANQDWNVLYHSDALTPSKLRSIYQTTFNFWNYSPLYDPQYTHNVTIANNGGVGSPYSPPGEPNNYPPNLPPQPPLIYCAPRNIYSYILMINGTGCCVGGSQQITILDECNNNAWFTFNYTIDDVRAALIASGLSPQDADIELNQLYFNNNISARQLWDAFQLHIVRYMPQYISYLNSHPNSAEIGCTYLQTVSFSWAALFPPATSAYYRINGKGLLGCG
ncbi:MAG: hypothetical protein H7246_23265 [Phycisphaerae bacterium]|nr:hypothetical protein [Saprospiraceae bacterium]